MTVGSAEGEMVSFEQIPCRTFMKNWFRAIKCNANSSMTASKIISTSGVTIPDSAVSVVNIVSNSAAGTTTYGIQVGSSGSSSLGLDEFKLGAVIPHGTGSGQLDYGATTVGSILASGSSYTFPIRRFMMNSSSGSIDVKEVGLVCRPGSSVTYPSLLSRDITNYAGVPINITVNPSQSLEVVYKFFVSPGYGLLKNFLTNLFSGSCLTPAAITRTNGTTTNISNLSDIVFISGIAEQSGYGLVLGTNSTPSAVTDYTLPGWINHGVTTGTLWYYNTEVNDITDDGIETSFMIQRAFGNDSGGTIIISEIGLVGYLTHTILYSRLVISPITLLAEESIRIRLKWRLLQS
jgi:hypothetical protein